MKLLNRTRLVRPLSGVSAWKFLLTGVLTVSLSVLLASPVYAQSDDKERKTKQTVAMSQPVYEALMEIQELVEAEDFVNAQQKIRELQDKKKLSPYEAAQIWNLSGYSYYLQENYDAAISSYENVLKQPELPEALQQSTLKTLAQLHFTVENYQLALETVERLMAVVAEPAADVYMLLGQAYFQMQKYVEAIPPIQTAIDMFKEQGRTPRENWLLLLRVCYWELKDFPMMLLVIEELIELYPKDTYVLTLAGVYSELGDTKKQLALTEALYEKGYIEGKSHAVNLANLYLLHGMPYKAATLLEKEMDAGNITEDVRNLRLLSQSWYSAREDRKAIPPLQKAAAVGEEGELFIRLAQSYLNLEEWGNAADAARKGLAVGDLKRQDTANIMYGMALFNQRKLEQARRAFQAAGKDKRSKRAAAQWIKYVDSEIRRRDTLEQKLPELEARDVDEILKANTPPDATG
ncbi:MAG: tetratricopeptide repeat protein [Xanthomonadales bacterium]|nr:tetratricopeptide repeat protein [Gammaproteobacteria bacterium]NNK03631.1 tetratricopeptide repeat protein [Xanthomonadales bacterium]NNL00403.1 tetratricopeptide repeat protein [Xanthomonadales bacterium]